MYLNNDLIIEILSRLPAQSVPKFRPVCKSWCKIIDSSTFPYSHLQNDNNDETLFLQFSKSKSSPCQLSILNAENGQSRERFPAFQKFLNENIGANRADEEDDRNWQCGKWEWRTQKVLKENIGKLATPLLPLLVAGPVNGLICMYNKTPYINSRGKRPWSLSVAVYNPCFDKINILPVSVVCEKSLRNWNEKEFIREIGFGFDSVTKCYKLVQLVMFSGSGAIFVEVYSGKTNAWRKLDTDTDTDSSLLFMSSIEGIKSSKSGSSAHWRIQRRTGQRYIILSFDMQSEVFETILYPDFEEREIDVATSEVFAKDDGSFALFFHTSSYHRFELWETERRDDSERCWTHVTDVNVEPIMPGLNSIRVMALWKKDGVVLMEYGYAYDYREGTLIFYDYSAEKERICREVPNADIEMLEYKGSLILP